MTRKKIHVTAEDIAQGKHWSRSQCPVTLAIRRSLNVSSGILVHGKRWDDGTHVYDLPRSAQSFIRKFDGLGPVKPLSFWTEVPDAS